MAINTPGIALWVSDRNGGYRTYDPDEIVKVKLALLSDEDGCKGNDDPNVFGPRHSTTWVDRGDKVAVTHHCPSWSRWYNPATSKMEGRSHCTCDFCF